MSDDLVNRLRGAYKETDPEGETYTVRYNPDGPEAADRIEELEAKLEELLAVSKRAVRLSLDHADFKLYAMEPMHQAIAAAELKDDGRQ
jgi:hypothetical protein